MENEPKCVFCDSPLNNKLLSSRIVFHRWIKEPNKSARKQVVTVILPTCKECHKKFYPVGNAYRIACYLGAIGPFCVFISLLNKDYFMISPIWAIIIFLLAGLFTYALICMSLCISFLVFENSFSPSLFSKPYNDLPLAKVLSQSGFVEGEGGKTPPNEVIEKFVPLGLIKDFLKKRFNCEMKI